ncbi:MAG TPA: hypothetical protein VI168_17625 [Croceibacterium sp.]
MARSIQIPAGDIGERQSAIQKLLASSADEAFDKLIDFASDFGGRDHKNDAIIISSEYYTVQRAQDRAVISFDEYSRKKIAISYKVLELIDHIVRQYPVLQAA